MMDLYKELNLNVVTDQPAVWIRKVVIYEQIDPEPVVIREVTLSRGLNIVWADEPGNDDPNAEITGHSAGKTGFCRLIRYILGESTFGTKANTGFIRKALSKGYVGAELIVRNQHLAVIRPLGAGRASYVQKGKSLVELLNDRGFPVYHENFLSSLGVLAILDGMQSAGIVQTGEPIQWGHLLAWITRDQEARFQNIHEWRSPRSDSESPSFRFPKAGPLFVMRTALGLILPDELKAEEELAELTRRQTRLEREQEELRREPQFRVNLYDRQLRQKVIELCNQSPESNVRGLAVDVMEMAFASDGLIPGLDKTAERVALSLESELTALNEQLELQQNKVDDLGANIRGLERDKNQLGGLIGIGQAAASELDQGLRQRREERSLLNRYGNDKCVLGGVFYSECTYVRLRRETLKSTQIQDAQAMKQAEAERQREVRQVEKEIEGIQQQLDDLETQRRELAEQLRRIRRDIKDKSDNLRDLKRVHEALAEWRGKSLKPDGFEKLNECTEDLTEIAETVTALEVQLDELIGKHESHRERLNRIFSASVRAVLPSGTYDGTVRLEGRELNYQINHGPAMSGEAVETLSVLLSDISNLVYSSVSEGSHLPGFLLHDSPREADLGIRIYWSFIRFVAKLQQHFGTPDACPFQYILTTTTAPPSELSGDDYVKLPLDASKPNGLLYKRDLATAAAQAEQQTTGGRGQSKLPFGDSSLQEGNSPNDGTENSDRAGDQPED